jgi:hypothetical protein
MEPAEAIKRYEETGRHLGKYDTIEQAGAAAEALHQNEARQISQHPQGPQQSITPEMMKALEGVFKDEARVPQGPPPSPNALPVLPAEAQPGPSSQPGPAGMSLAPGGLSSMPATNPLMPGGGLPSQGGSIAMAGMLPPIENATFSSPLLDTAATGFNTGGLSPFNTSGGFGGFNFGSLGGLGGGGGFNFGGGGGFDFGGGGMTMPMMSTFGGG